MSPINSSISHSFATATTFPKIATNGLIFYYDAGQQNSYNGTETWRDISGFGNPTNGTLTNGPTFSSANGGILVFDGVDDHIRASNSKLIHRTANWTYTFTMNFITFNRSTSDNLYGIFESGVTSGDTFLMRHQNYGGGSASIRLYAKFSSTSADGSVSFIPSTGVWYHLTFVRSGSSVDFYRNGVYSSSISNWNADINPSTQFIYIANEQQDSRPMNIKMANFIVYNRAITAVEVKQNFDAIRGRFGI
jgi:hypothetical protein